MFRPFNINNYVKVKLTDTGKRILAEYYGKIPGWYHEDEDGYWKVQMWSLAAIFGEHIHGALCFETNLLIDIDMRTKS